MKNDAIIPVLLAVSAVVAVLVLGGDAIVPSRTVIERPIVNIPPKLRQGNWSRPGDKYDGSCCHATLVSLLRWQGQYVLADRWRRIHAGGEFTWTMAEHLDEAGVPYAWTQEGDEAFLEWSIRTRRGAAIQILDSPQSKCYHMIALVDLTPKFACILDNNDPRRFQWIDRAQLMSNWKRSKGWAFTPCFSPAAPLPPIRLEGK